MKPLINTNAKIFCHQVLTENFYNIHHLMHSVIIHWFSLCIVIYIAVSAKPIFSISISCTTCEVQFSQVCMSYHVKLEIGVYSISDNGKSRNHLKGFKTFETCFFQSVYNGPPRASTNFLWSDQAGVRVILRNMI